MGWILRGLSVSVSIAMLPAVEGWGTFSWGRAEGLRFSRLHGLSFRRRGGGMCIYLRIGMTWSSNAGDSEVGERVVGAQDGMIAADWHRAEYGCSGSGLRSVRQQRDMSVTGQTEHTSGGK